jgi:hypothetical protein
MRVAAEAFHFGLAIPGIQRVADPQSYMIAGERLSIAVGMSAMSLTLAPVTARTASRLQHDHRGTDRHAIIEVDYVLNRCRRQCIK